MYRIDVGNSTLYQPVSTVEQHIAQWKPDVLPLVGQRQFEFEDEGIVVKHVLCASKARLYMRDDGGMAEQTLHWDVVDKKFITTPRHEWMPLLQRKKPANDVVFLLWKSGVSLLQLRHLWDADIEHVVVDGKPGLRLNKIKAKSGKILRRLLPKSFPHKKLDDLARKINEHNPQLARERALRSFKVFGGLAAAEQGGSLGSCMHGEGYWENLDFYLYPAPPNPDFSSPPPDCTGPYTIIWDEVQDKELLNGNENLRAFVWPVIMADGTRAWFMDRIYPANGKHTNRFAKDWAEMVGIKHVNTEYFTGSGTGVYEARAAAQPAMYHPVQRAITLDEELPWLDTFMYYDESGEILVSPAYYDDNGGQVYNTHSTSGNWEEVDTSYRTCERCDDRVHEDDSYWCEATDRTLCRDCYDETHVHCDECGEQHHEDDCLHIEDYVFCDEACAYDNGWSCCDDCGEWTREELNDDCQCPDCAPEEEDDDA